MTQTLIQAQYAQAVAPTVAVKTTEIKRPLKRDVTRPRNRGADNPNQAITDREAFENNKLEKRLVRLTGQAIGDFNMIEEGDRVMVCLSGGKDSYAMLDILIKLKARAPINFDIVAVNLDQKQPGFPADVLPNYLKSLGVEYHIETQDTYSIVKRNIPEGKTMCSLCSRLRRAILYRVAGELGCKKVALGHHRDDILATFFLNMFYGGRLKAMPPKLVSDNGKHIVIRPLAYVKEVDLIRYAQVKAFPIIPCTLCGSQENLQRKQMTHMLADWNKRFPGRVETAFNALSRAVPSHLLDPKLYDFANLSTQDTPFEGGDIAFDEDDENLCSPVTTTSDGDEMGVHGNQLPAQMSKPQIIQWV